jgi:CRP-like cAMP-binding protein
MAENPIATRLFRKLDHYIELGAEERQALQSAVGPLRPCRSHEELFTEGATLDSVSLLYSGFACQHKMTPDGRRQIIGYFLPGDLCNGCSLILRHLDHAVSTLSVCTVAAISRDTLLALSDRYPRIARALWWMALVEQSIAREWLLNVGQRTALERIAHLFCELLVRLRAVDLADGDSYELPLTQAELADTVALSTVHVNRTLKELRRQELIAINGKMLTILDVAALQIVGMFDSNYLHLEGEQAGGAGRSAFAGRRT